MPTETQAVWIVITASIVAMTMLMMSPYSSAPTAPKQLKMKPPASAPNKPMIKDEEPVARTLQDLAREEPGAGADDDRWDKPLDPSTISRTQVRLGASIGIVQSSRHGRHESSNAH